MPSKGIISTIRDQKDMILRHYKPEKTTGLSRIFEADGKEMNTPEYAEYLVNGYIPFQNFTPSQIQNGLNHFLNRKLGPIRDMGGESEPERFQVEREFQLSDSDVVTLVIKTTDPELEIVQIRRMREEVVL